MIGLGQAAGCCVLSASIKCGKVLDRLGHINFPRRTLLRTWGTQIKSWIFQLDCVECS